MTNIYIFVKVVFYCKPKMYGFSPKKIRKTPIVVEMSFCQVRTPVRTPRLVRVKCFTLLWVGVFLQKRMHAVYAAIYLR